MSTAQSPRPELLILAWMECHFVCTTGGCLVGGGRGIPVSEGKPCSGEIPQQEQRRLWVAKVRVRNPIKPSGPMRG